MTATEDTMTDPGPGSEDSRTATYEHSLRVGTLLIELVKEMLTRATTHDVSKTVTPEVEGFDRASWRLKTMAYDSPEYTASRADLADTLAHHYQHNPHHPEHGEPGLEWRPVIGYEGFYEVSNYGDVQGCPRVVSRPGGRGDLSISGKVRRAHVTPKGYLRLQLAKGGETKNHMVHRLVAAAFLENPESLTEVNHRDGNKKNNHVSNLEWVTEPDNQLHAYETDLREPNVKYVVHCPALNLTTMGCNEMERELRRRGFADASAAGIWRAMDSGGRHLSFSFEGTALVEYRRSRIAKMTLVDLVEMLADWKAATERMRTGTGDLAKSIQINKDRFGMSDELTQILTNTATAAGWTIAPAGEGKS